MPKDFDCNGDVTRVTTLELYLQGILLMIFAMGESVASRNCLATSALLILTSLPCLAQTTESPSHVIADKMVIPLYLPVAAMAGVSAEVTLRLQVNKNGDVASVNLVSAHADCGWLRDCSELAGSERESGFVEMATEAARLSRFSCSMCGGPTFGHIVTYQFQYPPLPKRACTPRPKETIAPPPLSTIDSSDHVTVRPTHWPCVSP